MGIIGVSLIIASVVYICMFPQPLLRYVQGLWQGPPVDDSPSPPSSDENAKYEKRDDSRQGEENGRAVETKNKESKEDRDRAAMPPPPIIRQPNSRAPPTPNEDEEQTTPKAAPVAQTDSVPTFSLSSSDPDEEEDDTSAYVPIFPAAFSAQRTTGPARPPPPPSIGLMGPPPRPSSLRPPTARTLPLPNRGHPARPAASGLAPPPTHTAKPAKPSRKVVLAPGHSPLDWARLAGSAAADLRGLPAASPYLRVAPSRLKGMNGRKGRDAWTALGGRVYNISPYLPFHPGGEGELLRCAGKGGDKLFGEIHPWVNYETMLAACVVGVMVEEHEAVERGGNMEEMD